jgi:diacylglycerol O-acyltransferase
MPSAPTETHHLGVNDAAWLFAESHDTPMHIGVLATFTKPVGASPTYLNGLVARWRASRTFAPPFNYQLRERIRPRWEELRPEAIDLDFHLRHSALPAPGGERELGVLVSRLHSTPLNRKYPLWECHVIEGLEGDRWAMYLKMHHSQVDGVGGIRLARRVFSVDPQARDMLPPWAVGTVGPDQSGAPARSRPALPAAGRGWPGPGLIRSPLSAVTSLGRTYLETLTNLHGPDRAVPFRVPSSIFNARVNNPRRFATQRYCIDRLRRVAQAGEASINDVFVTICGATLRRYLLDLHALPDRSLTATIPVSVRGDGAAALGNAITFLYAHLGTDVAEPVERLHAVRGSMQQGKARLPRAGRMIMDAYTVALMTPVLAQAVLGIGGRTPAASNLVISNVPGLAERRYYDGSLLEAFYPLSLVLHGQALNITAVSNADTFCIGFTGGRDNVPHLQRIAVYCADALDELETALGL